MARKRVRRKKRDPQVVDEEPEVEEELDGEDEDEEEDYDEEEEEEAPPPTRTRRTRRKKAAPTEDEEDDEDDEADVPTTKRTKRRKRVSAKDAAPDATPEDKVAQSTGNELADALIAVLDAGHSIAFRKVAGKYVFHKSGELATVQQLATVKLEKNVLTRAQMEDIAYTQAFKDFYAAWREFTYEEKLEIADKEDVTWERHENPKIDVMRLTAALRTSRGIDKWRPQYESRKARKNLVEFGIQLEEEDVEDDAE